VSPSIPDPTVTAGSAFHPSTTRNLRRTRVIGALILLLLAAFPRFHDLNHLSFYSDEAFTAMSARSVLAGDGAAMPTGMGYHRGLPFTWANAGAAALMGPDEERSYRVTAALFGTLTPPVLFLTGTAFVVPSAAFVAGAMLALSEWHVAFSRFGRMYSPFLFFFILSSYLFWRWARKGGVGNLAGALILFGMTVSLHLLGLFAAVFALIPLVLQDRVSPHPLLLLGMGLGAAALGYVADSLLIGTTYAHWSLPSGYQLPGRVPREPGVVASTSPPVLLATLGALVGAWLGWSLQRGIRNSRLPQRALLRLALVGAGTIGGWYVGGGHLWGATLATVVLFIMYPHPIWKAPRSSWTPMAILVLGGLAWGIFALSTMGTYAGVRRLVSFPFPYLGLLWFQFPGLVVLFACAVLAVLLFPSQETRGGLAGVILAVLLPLGAIGVLQDWGGTRYLFHLYPYMLLTVGALLVHAGTRISAAVVPGHRNLAGVGLALLVGLSGITGAHGPAAAVRAASLDHGVPVNRYIHIFPFRPDHRGAGLFVRDRLQEGDVVIAEDSKAQFVYAGQVDYWFRRAGDAAKFLYLASDGTPRDVYVNSALLSTVEGLEQVVASASGRVWLITSGETLLQRDWYLSEEQRRWLGRLEETMEPEFVGADEATRVYCLNCRETQGRSSPFSVGRE
jgi:hypothetical protein